MINIRLNVLNCSKIEIIMVSGVIRQIFDRKYTITFYSQ